MKCNVVVEWEHNAVVVEETDVSALVVEVVQFVVGGYIAVDVVERFPVPEYIALVVEDGLPEE